MLLDFSPAGREPSEHELSSFWLRKTRKAVMAVLLTQKDGGQATRGTRLATRET